jgi:c-di-GMP-related signal transduction protein
LREQTQILSKQLTDVIEQQQQHANTFVKLLDIVKTDLEDQDEARRSFIRGEILKMMPRRLTTKELQKIEEYRNLTRVFIDSTDSNNPV